MENYNTTIQDIMNKPLPKDCDEFWIHKPSVLFNSCVILPDKSMTKNQKLNALTRLLIFVVFILYVSQTEYTEYAVYVLLLGLIILFLMYCQHKKEPRKENFSAHRGQFDPCRTCCGQDSSLPYINYKYEVSPENQYTHENDGLRSYTHAKYQVLPVDTPAPYRQVWRNQQDYYNEYSMYPKSYDISTDYSYVPRPKEWFDDQITVGPLPCPEEPIQIKKKPGMRPRQGAFIRHSNEFRNNVMGEVVDQFYRERNHACPVFKPGRKTY